MYDINRRAPTLVFSLVRIPSVVSTRLTGYSPGQQQFDYPVQDISVVSDSQVFVAACSVSTIRP